MISVIMVCFHLQIACIIRNTEGSYMKVGGNQILQMTQARSAWFYQTTLVSLTRNIAATNISSFVKEVSSKCIYQHHLLC